MRAKTYYVLQYTAAFLCCLAAFLLFRRLGLTVVTDPTPEKGVLAEVKRTLVESRGVREDEIPLEVDQSGSFAEAFGRETWQKMKPHETLMFLVAQSGRFSQLATDTDKQIGALESSYREEKDAGADETKLSELVNKVELAAKAKRSANAGMFLCYLAAVFCLVGTVLAVIVTVKCFVRLVKGIGRDRNDKFFFAPDNGACGYALMPLFISCLSAVVIRLCAILPYNGYLNNMAQIDGTEPAKLLALFSLRFHPGFVLIGILLFFLILRIALKRAVYGPAENIRIAPESGGFNTADTSKARFCAYCGSLMEADELYCPACGAAAEYRFSETPEEDAGENEEKLAEEKKL